MIIIIIGYVEKDDDNFFLGDYIIDLVYVSIV